MLKSCKYCGRVHDSKYDCGKKPTKEKRPTHKDKFRWTQDWKNKRAEIKNRDKCFCQLCIRKLYDYGARQYNYEHIEIHHIDSLKNNFHRRLDNLNLISLCSRHHEMAESGEVSKELLFRIAREQEYPPANKA